jgi:hypothetical protein
MLLIIKTKDEKVRGTIKNLHDFVGNCRGEDIVIYVGGRIIEIF